MCGCKHHLPSRFCGVELDLKPTSNMVSVSNLTHEMYIPRREGVCGQFHSI